MGRFQKVSAEDHDDDEELAAEDYGQEHWRPAGMCCGCLTPKEAAAFSATSVLFGFIALTAASFVVNAVARHSLALVATSSLGARIALGAVSIGVFSSQSSVSDIMIDNPPGYGRQGAFVRMQKSVFDLQLPSVFEDPVTIQELTLSYIVVNIEQQADLRSNANVVVAHLSNASHVASLPGLQASIEQAAEGEDWDTTQLVSQKFIVDKIELDNIEASVCISPVCDASAPVTFAIRRIVVDDVGKLHGGVRLNDLIHIIMQALLVAVVQSAPGNIGGQMHRSFGQGLKWALDYAMVRVDTGSGLQEISDWNSWETSQFGISSIATGGGLVQGQQEVVDTLSNGVTALGGDGVSVENVGPNLEALPISQSQDLSQAVPGVDPRQQQDRGWGTNK